MQKLLSPWLNISQTRDQSCVWPEDLSKIFLKKKYTTSEVLNKPSLGILLGVRKILDLS